jgi:hypothetical protein
MKDDAFRWAMYKNGEEVPCICGPNKEQVWDSFLAIETELSRQAGQNKIYTMMQRPLFEQLGYSVEESKVWRLAHAKR